MENIYVCLENIVYFYYKELYQFFKKEKLEIWNIFWIEWIYGLFLRSFSLKACLILWDLIIINNDAFLFKIVWVVFGLIKIHFDDIDKNNFYENAKKLILINQDDILYSLVNSDVKIEEDVETIADFLNNL